ncbi:hypothetical protein [Paracoccus sp. (in: a-proteobacteria)]|uniref:hypothetical protein n=1 Tax=Paracoccus sp. TaxID=267 RepID=UPI0032202618
MTRTPRNSDGDTREARLKAALRANLARRKAQGRARAADDTNETEQHGTRKPPNGRRPENEE